MLDVLEPPVLYVIVLIIGLAVASLVGLVLFASKEETFEDVVAQQRKEQEALLSSLQGGSAKSGKQNRKWNKLKNKKASKKGPEENEIDSGVDDDEPSAYTVNVNVPPPTVVVKEPPPPSTSGKKGKKGKKAKMVLEAEPTVLVKKEIVKSSVDGDLLVNASNKVGAEVEEPHIVEQEEVIVESSVEAVEAAPESPFEEEVIEASAPEVEVEEPVTANEVEAIPPPEKETKVKVEVQEKSKKGKAKEVPSHKELAQVDVPQEKSKSIKKKSSSQKNKGVIVSVEKLEADIASSQLSAVEIQLIIDSLLAKQNELEQWHKPNQKSDPVEQLKRRITELETQYTEEHNTAHGMAVKNKELKLELQHERNQRQSIQTEAANRIGQQIKEGESIRKRMEEKHMSEMQSAQAQIQRMQVLIDDGANHHKEVQRMKEENTHLKNASMMAQQLAEDKQSLMTELAQLQQSNKQVRQELDNAILHKQQSDQHYEQELQNLKLAKGDSENALSLRLQEVNDELMKVEAKNRSLSQQVEVVERSKVEMESLQQSPSNSDELQELKNKLSDISAKLQESESSLTVKCKELEDSCAKLSEAENKLSSKNDSVDGDISDLKVQIAEKDQLILDMERKLADAETNQGSIATDIVVVSKGDFLESESKESKDFSESFEEVNADKDFQEDQLNKESLDDLNKEQLMQLKTLDTKLNENLKQMELLESEVEERKSVEKALRDNLDKVNEENKKYHDELDEAKRLLSANVVQLSEKESIIAEKEAVISENNKVASANETAAVSFKDRESNLNKLISEKDALITELKAKVVKIEGEYKEMKDNSVKTDQSGNEELMEKMKLLEQQLEEKTDSEKSLRVVTDQLKDKNNDLREKNWKVMDALGKTEKTSMEKLKAIEHSVLKGLKTLHPNVNIPEYNNDMNLLFEGFSQKVAEKNQEGSHEHEEVVKAIKEENEKLTKEVEELRKTSEETVAKQGEVAKWQEENMHLKNVLTETESMLSRLQAGVDAEVQKWQMKVDEKDNELGEAKKNNEGLKQVLLNYGYEHENLSALENCLADGQKQLMAEKEENIKLKAELKEKADSQGNEAELADINNKLKKTISERDLLIREYKAMKDNSAKMEGDLKATKEALNSKIETSETRTKEIEQLKKRLATIEAASSSKDKDKIIAKLTIEVEELKEELRAERDCVIVDIDPVNAENLHKQVEELSTELESEKKCNENLATKLQDIEKSFQEETSDSDKILNLESKLKSAEVRITELESENEKLNKVEESRRKGGASNDMNVGTSV